VPAGSDPDFPAVDVLANVLGNAPSGRLYRALVETRLAASVSAYDYKLREPGVLIATAEVRKDVAVDTARSVLLATLADLLQRPPTDEEVERAKGTLLKNIELLLNNSERVGLNLSEWVAMGDWRMLFLFRDRLRQVTARDVGRVAAAYVKTSNLTLGTFLPTDQPDRAEIPPPPDVAALVKDYRGDTLLTQGEAFDPSPENIDRRTTRTTLSGGLKVALLPKQTRGQAVRAALTLRFGSLDASMGLSVAGDLTADMLLRGTRNLSREQIKDSLDRLKARVSLNGGATQVGVRIETTRPYLGAVLRLVGQVLREPTFEPKEFEALRQENLAGLEQQKSDPQALAFAAYQRYLQPYPKGDPRYTPTVEEQVADYSSATLDQVRSFYARFYGAGTGELAVVGDFDPGELLQVIEEILGGWPSPGTYQRIGSDYTGVAATSITIETPDKANGMFLAGENWNLRDDDPDFPALVLANELLGGGFLNSRLATRIRQKEGVSYGVGSFLAAPALDRSGRWTTWAIYAPENAARLETAFREEIDRALKDGFSDEEVAKAKAGYLQNQQVVRSQDGALAGSLASGLFLGRTLAFDAAFEKKIASLTAAEVSGTLRRYLDPAKISVVKAGDFARKRGDPAKP
jgi:zinc protease